MSSLTRFIPGFGREPRGPSDNGHGASGGASGLNGQSAHGPNGSATRPMLADVDVTASWVRSTMESSTAALDQGTGKPKSSGTGTPYRPAAVDIVPPPLVNAIAEPEAESGSDRVESEGAGNGVHAITKKTNYWFDRETHQIERLANEMAAEWAVRGLPRHDVPRTAPLEPEQVLAARCEQLFRDWQLRVRTKMQDAIEEGSQQVGECVSRFRGNVSRLSGVNADIEANDAAIEKIRHESEKHMKPVRYDRFVPHTLFWPIAIMLALVEFFANFPIFRLLLPLNAALAGVAKNAADNIDDTNLLAGPKLLLTDMLLHTEALVVALVAVVVLVILAKTTGSSFRPIRALREEEHPFASDTIRAHRRQHGALTLASVLGVVCVLTFLVLSRAQISTIAGERVTHDENELTRTEQEFQSVRNDLTKAGDAQKAVIDARRTLEQHRDDLAYARTVQQNNFPILALNIALVIAAAVLGYGYKHEDLTDQRGEHPALAPLREKAAELRREAFALAHDARAAAGQAHGGISRVRHLVAARPLEGWRSKADRLEGVIPLFRAENARLRGLDPANILAFRDSPQLEPMHVAEPVLLAEPKEFARLQAEFDELCETFAHLAPRAVPAPSDDKDLAA